ncbi:hypothetical protein Ahy_A06g028370 [Arachis hypogaea]|uniref:CCHC-type domain-containing protein n=1 Tax=Arachis hypogaea TaxID=3818 RepID=A0A445CQZ1_ARAHY|nr:hypothetical protein Ahy_A06g028370 [Arachis hypogaea]
MNFVLKGARNLPVTTIVRSTFYQLNELFTRKSTEAHERVRNGFTYSEFATKRVEESFQQAGNIVVNRFDRRNEMFERLDWQVYVPDVYKMSKICKEYRGEFVPMDDPSMWDRYEGAKDKRGPRRCTICGRKGHSRSRCPQRVSPSPAGGRILRSRGRNFKFNEVVDLFENTTVPSTQKM